MKELVSWSSFAPIGESPIQISERFSLFLAIHFFFRGIKRQPLVTGGEHP